MQSNVPTVWMLRYSYGSLFLTFYGYLAISEKICIIKIPISFKIASLALEPSYHFPNDSEVNLVDITVTSMRPMTSQTVYPTVNSGAD